MRFELFPSHGTIYSLPSVAVFIIFFLLMINEKNDFTPHQRFVITRAATILSFIVKSEATFYLPDCLIYVTFFLWTVFCWKDYKKSK